MTSPAAGFVVAGAAEVVEVPVESLPAQAAIRPLSPTVPPSARARRLLTRARLRSMSLFTFDSDQSR
ncbi:hypothetical protein FK531_09935 [Rhodococcus spelaei]|uniref:Uncharacterized protein n=1 Tax=Rhodococcus spelaei TaxID=2546320 RepID=A0A541B9T7_9NOCA|nr:hypothetical protein FK531_09935 [Rhodococcus spelaei]